MDRQLSLQRYKAIKVRQAFKPYLNNPRYEQMRRGITCVGQALGWTNYRTLQEQERVINSFCEIEQLRYVDYQSDNKLIQLELLLQARTTQLQLMQNPVAYDRLVALLIDKNGQVGYEEIRALGYEQQTTKAIQNIIKSAQFGEWRQIQQVAAATKGGTLSGKKQQHQKEDYKRMVGQSVRVEHQQSKISKWLARIEQANPDAYDRLLQYQLLRIMHRVLAKGQEVKLAQIEATIKKEPNRWNSKLEEFIKSERGTDQQLVVVLDGSIGYLKLRRIFDLLLPLNIFELEQRCQLSELPATLDHAVFVVGNTGVGKTTFIQSLLGYTHAKKKDSYGNINLIIDGQVKQQHRLLEAGRSSESITTHLTSVAFTSDNRTVTLIDTPGFEDTRGALTDIANQIMLARAYEKCVNSAYIILSELKQLELDRYQGVMRLALNISSRFQYQTLQELGQFVLLVFNNKFNETGRREIQNLRKESTQFYKDYAFLERKNGIALDFVVQSLKKNQHFFGTQPTNNNLTQIRALIASLKFNGNRKLSTNFENQAKLAIGEMGKLLKATLKSKQVQIDKKPFYYEILCKMQNLLPSTKSEKREVDQTMENHADSIYQRISTYLKQILISDLFQQAEFTDFTTHIKQLEQLHILVKFNSNIKSKQEIKHLFQTLERDLLAGIQQSFDSTQLQPCFSFITQFYRYEDGLKYKQYCPQLLPRIKQHLFSQLQQLKDQCYQAVSDGNPNRYDEAMAEYERYEGIYDVFYQHFNRVENMKALTRRSQIVATLLETVKTIKDRVLARVGEISRWLIDDSNPNFQIQQLNQSYQSYELYQQLQILSKASERQQLKSQITLLTSKCFAQILNQFEVFMEFSEGFYQKFASQSCRVNKLIKLKDQVRVRVLKSEIKHLLQNLEKIHSQKITAFIQVLKYINKILKSRQRFSNSIKGFEMGKQVEVFQTLSPLSNYELVPKMVQLYDQYKKGFVMFQKQLAYQIQQMQESNIEQAKYVQLIQAMKVLEGYAKSDSKDYSSWSKTNEYLHEVVGKELDKLKKYYIKKKFSNFQTLEQKVNPKLISQLRSFIYNFLIPTTTITKTKSSTLEEGTLSVYDSVKQIFEKLQTFVNDQKVFVSAQEKAKRVDFKDISQNYVKCLRYIYALLKKQANSDGLISQYLLNPLGNLQMTQFSFSLKQIQRAVEEKYINKMKQVRQQITMCSLIASNLKIFGVLKTQCYVWMDLEDVIKRQNNALYKQSIDHFREFVDILMNHIARIQEKQLSKIQKIIDMETHTIHNILEIGKIYNELKANIKSKISKGSQETLQLFLQKLQSCITYQSKSIKVKLLHHDCNEMSYEIVSLFEQQIQLYEVLQSNILFNDIKQYKISFIEQVKNTIDHILKNIDFSWSSTTSAIQKLIEERDFSKARKMIIILQSQKDLIAKVGQIEESIILSGQQQVQFIAIKSNLAQDIKRLQQKLQIQQKNREYYLENPFKNEENASKITHIYTSQTVANKQKLKKKMRQYFNEKLELFKSLPKEESTQLYNELSEFLQRLPEGVAKDYDWYNQLHLQNKRKEQQEVKELSLVASLKSDSRDEKIYLFSQFQLKKSLRFRLQLSKKIKQIFRQAKLSIRESKSLQEKVRIFEQLQSMYNTGNCQSLKIQISSVIHDFEYGTFKYFQDYATFCFQQIQLQLSSPAIAQKEAQINQNIEEGTAIYIFSRRYQQNNVIPIKKIIDSFQTLITFFGDNFQSFCPLSSSWKQLNESTGKISRFRQLFVRMRIYKKMAKIIKDIQKQQNSRVNKNKSERSMEIEHSNQFLNEFSEIFAEIEEEIECFKNKLESRTQKIYKYLSQFKFEDQSLYNCEYKIKIKYKVQSLKNYLQFGLNFAFFSQIDQKYVVKQSFISQQKQRYNKQFNKFLKDVLDRYRQFVGVFHLQLPRDFEYLQYLTYYLSSESKINFLQFQYFNILRPENNNQKALYSNLNALVQNDFHRQATVLKTFQLNIVSRLASFHSTKNHKEQEFAKRKQQQLKRVQNQKKKNMNIVIYSLDEQQQGEQDITCKVEAEYLQQEEKILCRYKAQIEEFSDINFRTIQNDIRDYFNRVIMIIKIRESTWNTKVRSLSSNRIQEVKEFVRKNKLEKYLLQYISEFERSNRYVFKLKKYMQLPNLQKIKRLNSTKSSQLCNYIVNRISKIPNTSESFECQIHQSFDFLKLQISEFISQMNYIRSFAQQNQIAETIKKLSLKKDGRIKFLATIAAVWSLSKSPKAQLSKKDQEYGPHIVQIIAILLLSKSKGQMTNQESQKFRLVEMEFGQGKSLVLAILATFYALKGYKVSIACYSSHLSSISKKDFSLLFETFEVRDNIFYGSLYEVCQNMLVIENKPLGEVIKSNLLQKQAKEGFGGLLLNQAKKIFQIFSSKDAKAKHILLFDEIDMLFQPQYLQQSLKPTLKIKLPEVSRLLKYVWEQMKQKKFPEPKQIFETESYRSLVKQYPKLKEILDHHVNQMLTVAHKSPTHRYQIYGNDIRYKNQEKCSVPIYYQYQTIFSYMRQYQNKNVDFATYQNELVLPVKLGEFSYLEILKSFQMIQGLSGTLSVLQPCKHSILNEIYEFSSENMYLLPSLYLQNQQVEKSYIICNDETFFKSISETIERRNGSPVVVCFQNYKQLRKFQISLDVNQRYQNRKYNTIHFMKDIESRTKAIDEAGQMNALTLITSEFIHGLNIEVNPFVTAQKTGLHFVLTYIPDCSAEFYQFMGRTGRLGEVGSISILFNTDQFKKKIQQLDYSPDLPPPEEVEECLAQYQRIYDSFHSPSKLRKLKDYKNDGFMRTVQLQGKQFMRPIIKANQFQRFTAKKFKIIIAINGMKNLQPFLQPFTHNLTYLFQHLNKLREITSAKYSFLLQLVVYNNYRSTQKVIKMSEFETELQNLQNFLVKNEFTNDQKSAAFEIFARYINQISDLDMVFVISNTRANKQQQIQKQLESQYWKAYHSNSLASDHQYLLSKSTYQDEVKRFPRNLIINGVSVCNRRNSLKDQFYNEIRELSALFNGETKQINLNSKTATEESIKFIATRIAALLSPQKTRQEIDKIYQKTCVKKSQ